MFYGFMQLNGMKACIVALSASLWSRFNFRWLIECKSTLPCISIARTFYSIVLLGLYQIGPSAYTLSACVLYFQSEAFEYLFLF